MFKQRYTEHYDYPQLSIFDDNQILDHRIDFSLKNDSNFEPSVMYIHIPFCEKFCIFCNYYKELPNETFISTFKKALIKEIAYYSKILPRNKKSISAIHFGGGSPSVLPSAFYEKILGEIQRHFYLSNDCVISMEGNVNHFAKKEYIAGLKSVGINRISFGVQSLNDKIRRTYFLPDTRLIYETIEKAQKNAIYDYNIDLMYNFPEQSPEAVIRDIQESFKLHVNCIDLYSLNVFPHTGMEKYLKKNDTLNIYNDRQKLLSYKELYQYISESEEINLIMSNTISKMSKEPNRYLKYHLGNNERNSATVIGLGPSSRGYLAGIVYKNFVNLLEYCNSVDLKGNGMQLMKELTNEEKENRVLVMFPNYTFLPKTNLNLSKRNKTILDELIKHQLVLEDDEKFFISRKNCYWAGNISSLFYSFKQNQKMNRTAFLNFKEKLNMYNQDKMIVFTD